MATRRVRLRLYPTKKQEEKLHYWRRLHQLLYNACLYQRKVEYERFGKSISYLDQQNSLPAFKECWHEYKEPGSHELQATVKRVDFAYKRFFQKLGERPKFKSSRDYRGWTYPCKSGWKASTNGENGYLVLSNLENIQMKGKARTWGRPTTGTILWKQGKWYASITVDCQPVREKELSERVHQCSNCGYTCDRDVAAAQVMLSWALGTSVDSRGAEASTSTPAFCGGFKQAFAVRRQKPLAQP